MIGIAVAFAFLLASVLAPGRRTWRALVLVVAVGAAGFVLSAQAAETTPATVIIIDSSGSMAAREPDGRVRLDVARETIVEALGAWPAGAKLAVVAYGHRRTSDCSDIETIVPLGPVSTGEIKRKLADLRARGKTPLSDSLRSAASLLPAEGGDIVLVSDGLETCAADPCAVARDLTAAKAKVTIHVIGLGLTNDERAQLQCIAENGGGRYFGAADGKELATALDEVAAVVAEPEAKPAPEVKPVLIPEPEPVAPPPPTPKPISLTATAGALGEIVDAAVSWTITGPEGERVYQGESRALGLSLLPGRYEVSAAAANATGSAEIVVLDEAAAQAFEVEVMAGRLDLTLAANAKAEPFSDLEAQGIAWTLEPLDGQPPAQIPALAKPSLLLAPGSYKVGAQLQGMQAEGTVKVAPGQPVALQLDFQLGVLTLEAGMADEGPALEDDRALSWRVGSGDAATAVKSQSHPRLTLKAGKYPVGLSVAGLEMTAEAEVVAGEERVKRVVVKGGELGLAARLGPDAALLDDWRDTTWTVTAVAAVGFAPGAPASDEAIVEAQPHLTLMPGTWRVSLVSGAAHAEKDVTIAPETVTDLVVDVGAARLMVIATPEAGEPPLNIVYAVHALGADGTPAGDAAFSIGSSTDASVILPAGHWRVTALDDVQRTAEADVELGAGEEKRLELSLK